MHVFLIKLPKQLINNILILQQLDISVRQMINIVKFSLKEYTMEFTNRKNISLDFLKRLNLT